MSITIYEELSSLAAEFDAIRQTTKRIRFAKTLWQQAIAIAQQLSIAIVCRAIKISAQYFRKKMALLAQSETEQSVTFVELIQPKTSALTIHIESSFGHKLLVEGLAISSFGVLLSEFFKAGSPCCK